MLFPNSASYLPFEEDLLGRLVDVVLTPHVLPRANSSSRRRRGFDRALEFLRETDGASVSISELSEVAGVSIRTLEHAFREAFDLTARGSMRLRRFHKARCELMVADPHRTTVTEIACNARFYHVARFAVDYRRLFGEPPSQTLKRQYTHKEDELSPLIGR